MDRYSDPGMQLDWHRPFTFDWHPSRPTATQEAASPGSLRRLITPVSLPAVVTVDYTLARDGSGYAVSLITAALDPAVNHGYRHVGVLPWHDGAAFASIEVRTDPADPATEATLVTCPRCQSPWATWKSHGEGLHGARTYCPACSYCHTDR